jgi:hypothetical protein
VLSTRTLLTPVVGCLTIALCVCAYSQQAQQKTAQPTRQSQKPKLEEILSWLAAKVNAQTYATVTLQGEAQGIPATLIVNDETWVVDSEGCNVGVRHKYYTLHLQDGQVGNVSDETKEFDLAKLSPDTRVEKHQFGSPVVWTPDAGWVVIAASGDASGRSDLKLNIMDEALSSRVTKALGDAILRCGGKKIKELY